MHSQRLDPGHTFESAAGGELAPEHIAAQAYHRSVNDDDKLPLGSPDMPSQKQPSACFDKRTLANLEASSNQSQRAHLGLVCAKDAGAFLLQALPSKAAKLNTEPALFVAMLQRRLRMRFSEEDLECNCVGLC